MPIINLDLGRTLVHVYTAISMKNLGISWELTDDVCRGSRRLSSFSVLWQGPPLTSGIKGTQSLFSVPPNHWSHYHCKIEWHEKRGKTRKLMASSLECSYLTSPSPALTFPTNTNPPFFFLLKKRTLPCSQSFLLSVLTECIRWVNEIELGRKGFLGPGYRPISLHTWERRSVKGRCDDESSVWTWLA